VKGRKFVDWLSDCWLLKTNSDPWSLVNELVSCIFEPFLVGSASVRGVGVTSHADVNHLDKFLHIFTLGASIRS
jgi:hypothetical protein